MVKSAPYNHIRVLFMFFCTLKSTGYMATTNSRPQPSYQLSKCTVEVCNFRIIFQYLSLKNLPKGQYIDLTQTYRFCGRGEWGQEIWFCTNLFLSRILLQCHGQLRRTQINPSIHPSIYLIHLFIGGTSAGIITQGRSEEMDKGVVGKCHTRGII